MADKTIVPVTVVIPCFNCAKTIVRAVTSIVLQTQKPAEVILVDDASGDGTLELLREIEQQYSGWIKVTTLAENQGAASARNAGWSIATQPYIAFLDADDSWHPEKLRIQYEYMRNNPDVALCGHQCIWLSDGETLPVLPEDFHTTRISAGRLLFKNAFSTPTVMLRDNLQFRFQGGKRCAEDLLLWQQIAFAGLQVMRIESALAYVHKPLYGAGGLSSQLWEMEKGELANFGVLYRAKSVNLILCTVATFFSIAKFVKRLLITKLKGLSTLLLGGSKN
jgi:glycosyltransferase involved in cell wall biosynthesis